MTDDLTNLRSVDDDTSGLAARAKRDPKVAARLAIFDAVRTKFPGERLWYFETMDGDLLVVASADENSLDEFMQKAQSTKGRGHEHMKFLVLQCLRHPTDVDYAVILKRFPGLPVTLGTDLLKIGGGEAPDLLKKV